MPRVAAAPLALALGLAATLALAACGGGSDAKLLAGNTAQEIRENLDSVQRLVEEGECVGAEDAALSVSSQVEAVEGIDPKLKQLLQEGAERLNEVVDQCAEAEVTTEETIPAPTESPEEQANAEKESEKEQKDAEKEQEKTEKEAEKEQKDVEKEQEKAEKEAEKEQKEAEKEQAHEEPEGGEPSGGVGPGSATGEGG
jgi:septal ring-binding cell division protein DamX